MKHRAASLILALALVLGLPACGQSAPTWQEQYDLGVRYLSEGKYEEAIIAFTAAIEIDPKRAEAYLSLADVYLALEDYEEARAVLERALEQAEDTQAVQSKLEEVEALAVPAEPDAQPDGGGQEPQPGADPEPGGEPDPSQEPGEAPEDPQETTDEEPEQTDPAQETPEPEPDPEPEPEPEPEPQPEPEPEPEPETQLPGTFTSYQYAVDMVGSATLWDAHQSVTQSTGSSLQECYLTSDGYTAYMNYGSAPSGTYIALYGSTPEALWETSVEDYTQQEVLALSDQCLLSEIHGSYGPSGLAVSPVFPAGMTYDEIVQVCEANGYSYFHQEDGMYLETYLSIDLGGKTLRFIWDGFEIEGIGAMVPRTFDLW